MFPDFDEILYGINSLLASEAAETHGEWFRASGEGLPLGLQLVGLKMGDEALLDEAERIAELVS